MREKVYIATKTAALTVEGFWKDLETSLATLKTDYIDIYQFHNPAFCPKPGDGSGLYEAMLEAKAQGKIRHIGITNHRLTVAMGLCSSHFVIWRQRRILKLRRPVQRQVWDLLQ